MKKITLPFEYFEFESPGALPEKDRQLVEQARDALESAYTPYSRFRVGTAVQLGNGRVVVGSNQENRAFPSGLCAERVAIYAAAAQYPGIPVLSVAIAARSDGTPVTDPVPPCGACRQVLLEYELKQGTPIRIILAGEAGRVFVVDSVNSLLPLAFTEDGIGAHNPVQRTIP